MFVLSDYVDLGRYPLDRRGGAAYEAVLASAALCRHLQLCLGAGYGGDPRKMPSALWTGAADPLGAGAGRAMMSCAIEGAVKRELAAEGFRSASCRPLPPEA